MSLGFGFEYRGSPPMPVVTVLEPDGPAIAAGVQVGDTIWQVDGVDIPGGRKRAADQQQPRGEINVAGTRLVPFQRRLGLPGHGQPAHGSAASQAQRVNTHPACPPIPLRCPPLTYAIPLPGKQEPLLSPGGELRCAVLR
eukprot:3938170-Rhodomonas_salina.2